MSLLLFAAQQDYKRVQNVAPGPAGGLEGHPRALSQVPASFAGVVLACGLPCCGAKHETVNEGFLSVVGGFAQWGGNVADANGSGF